MSRRPRSNLRRRRHVYVHGARDQVTSRKQVIAHLIHIPSVSALAHARAHAHTNTNSHASSPHRPPAGPALSLHGFYQGPTPNNDNEGLRAHMHTRTQVTLTPLLPPPARRFCTLSSRISTSACKQPGSMTPSTMKASVSSSATTPWPCWRAVSSAWAGRAGGTLATKPAQLAYQLAYSSASVRT